MKNVEELTIDEIIEEEGEYNFCKKGFDFLRASSPIPEEVISYKWLFVPLIFLISFIGFGGYGLVLDGCYGIKPTEKLLTTIGLIFLIMIFSIIAFGCWRKFNENKVERNNPPKSEFSLFIPLKKPHSYKFEEGDKIKFLWEISSDCNIKKGDKK